MPVHQVEELREKRAESYARMGELNDSALGEERDLTPEEQQEYDRVESEFDRVTRQVDRIERHEGIVAPQMTRSVAAPNTDPQQPGGEVSEPQSYAEWRAAANGRQGRDAPEYRKALYNHWATGGPIDNALVTSEMRALSKATAAAGANLVPTDFETRVLELVKEYGVMAQLATEIITDSGAEIKIPTETTAGVAAWTAENAAFAESDDAFGQVALAAHKATRVTKVSDELLADSFYDLESHLARSFGRAFGILENTAMVVGDGSAKPTGITTQTTAGKTGATGQTTSVAADDLMDLYHSVLSPYRRNASWLLGDGSVKAVRKLKTGVAGDNTYLWQPGLLAGAPDTLLGRPVYTDPDVAAMAANAKSILFGDFSYYWIRRARGFALQRLVELYSANGQVGFRGFIRVDGKLIDTAAVKHYANSAI